MRRIDQHFATLGKGFKLECKKGCSNCCRTFTWTGVEIAYALELISGDNHRKFKWLKNKLPKYDEIHDQRVENAHISKLKDTSLVGRLDDQKCIFLHKGQCSIYENRPLICRMTASEISEKCTGNLKVDPRYKELMASLGEALGKINMAFSEPIAGGPIVGFVFRFFR